MGKKQYLNLFLTIILFLLVISTLTIKQPFSSLINPRRNYDFQNFKLNEVEYSNVTVISDGYMGSYWNDQSSGMPDIAIDPSGIIHVVWEDDTDGIWGTDHEIMYAHYKDVDGWSNATVISDGYMGSYWNDGDSYNPNIAVDDLGSIHVVWHDMTDGIWGTDQEIMYARYTEVDGWSNAMVISDGYMGIYWNSGDSYLPRIAVDELGDIHVVWEDDTDGIWGTDHEIMYARYKDVDGWSNATVVSDGYMGSYWNDGDSHSADIALDGLGNIHVVWEDDTDGIWSTDYEIMYASYKDVDGWSNATVISDGYLGDYWNEGYSHNPYIAADEFGVIHVVWWDDTDGIWGEDWEIMYASYKDVDGWSNATVISDGYMGSYWNDGDSIYSAIATGNSGSIHVVWADDTDGIWGDDWEVMYVSYTELSGWSNVTIISDGYMGYYWNDDASGGSTIATDVSGGIHVVWTDYTDGIWGTDVEVMYTNLLNIPPPGPLMLSSTAEAPDDDGIFNLTWTLSDWALNYSVYESNAGYISVINSSVTLVQDGLTNNSISLAGYVSGTYYFAIEAINDYGKTLSNCALVEIQILQAPSISFGHFFLSFMVLGILGSLLCIKRKSFVQS